MNIVNNKELFGFLVSIERDNDTGVHSGWAVHRNDASIQSPVFEAASLSGVHTKIYDFVSNYTQKSLAKETIAHDTYRTRTPSETKEMLKQLLKGLQGTSVGFGQGILENLRAYQQAWGCTSYVRFGNTGKVKSGEAGAMPRYQIENANQGQRVACLNSHKLDKRNASYRNENITQPFTIEQIQRIWSIQ